MKTIKKQQAPINFDFQKYYRSLGNPADELTKIRIEAEYFRYYDSLSKEQQIVFKNLDKQTRLSEADLIQKEIRELAVF